MARELYFITLRFQRHNNERFTWVQFLSDFIHVNGLTFDDWSTSTTRALVMDYPTAVERKIKLREKYPHAVIDIMPRHLY